MSKNDNYLDFQLELDNDSKSQQDTQDNDIVFYDGMSDEELEKLLQASVQDIKDDEPEVTTKPQPDVDSANNNTSTSAHHSKDEVVDDDFELFDLSFSDSEEEAAPANTTQSQNTDNTTQTQQRLDQEQPQNYHSGIDEETVTNTNTNDSDFMEFDLNLNDLDESNDLNLEDIDTKIDTETANAIQDQNDIQLTAKDLDLADDSLSIDDSGIVSDTSNIKDIDTHNIRDNDNDTDDFTLDSSSLDLNLDDLEAQKPAVATAHNPTDEPTPAASRTSNANTELAAKIKQAKIDAANPNTTKLHHSRLEDIQSKTEQKATPQNTIQNKTAHIETDDNTPPRKVTATVEKLPAAEQASVSKKVPQVTITRATTQTHQQPSRTVQVTTKPATASVPTDSADSVAPAQPVQAPVTQTIQDNDSIKNTNTNIETTATSVDSATQTIRPTSDISKVETTNVDVANNADNMEDETATMTAETSEIAATNKPDSQSKQPIDSNYQKENSQGKLPALMESDRLQQTSAQIETDMQQLKSYIQKLNSDFHQMGDISARLLTQIRILQRDSTDDFSMTHQQMMELRNNFTATRQQAIGMTGLLDLVEEALESDMYVAQTHNKN